MIVLQAVITDAIFLSNYQKQWVNSDGEVKTYYRAEFAQNGSPSLVLNIEDNLYNAFDVFGVYNLDVELSSYKGNARQKVTGFARVDARGLDIA